MNCFLPAQILLPQGTDMEKWAVIACDQFTSQPEYWERVRRLVGQAPSTLHLILPESELAGDYERKIPQINQTMERYLQEGVFRCYPDVFVYVERTLTNGEIRRGLVGKLDLEQYDYSPDAVSAVRATEKTVVERLPPRMKIREHASVELPHVLLLCDDPEKQVIEPLTEKKERLCKLYDFSLMEGGGRIAGWLVQGEELREVRRALERYETQTAARSKREPMLYAVGDGNHSLATAKACWEKQKAGLSPEERERDPARYALVELENLQDECQKIEAIHRIVKKTEVAELLQAARESICAPDGYPVAWFSGGEGGTLFLDPAKGQLPVGILQGFLDAYLNSHGGEIDYIHDEEALRTLSGEEDTVGFLLPAIEKSQLFRGIMADGVLPRKTFSMGHAVEKRYYLEGRKIV